LNKLTITAALVATIFATTAAVASNNVFLSEDYTSPGVYETQVGVAVPTKVGKFDGALLFVNNHNDVAKSSDQGYEVGYSLGYKVSNVQLSGRASFGGYTGSTNFYTLGAEAAYPVNKTFGVYTAYRHRNGESVSQNRYSAGVEANLTKTVKTRLAYNYTRAAEEGFNGVTGTVALQF